MIMVATKPRPRVAMMADPPDEDRESAIIVAVHTARETLSIVERAADGTAETYFPALLGKIEAADSLFRTAEALCEEVSAHRTQRARQLLQRARERAKAAYHHGQTARSYAELTEPSSFEAKQRSKTRAILRRATEAAKQEAHRALTELAEVFPDAYDVEEEEKA